MVKRSELFSIKEFVYFKLNIIQTNTILDCYNDTATDLSLYIFLFCEESEQTFREFYFQGFCVELRWTTIVLRQGLTVDWQPNPCPVSAKTAPHKPALPPQSAFVIRNFPPRLGGFMAV